MDDARGTEELSGIFGMEELNPYPWHLHCHGHLMTTDSTKSVCLTCAKLVYKDGSTEIVDPDVLDLWKDYAKHGPPR